MTTVRATRTDSEYAGQGAGDAAPRHATALVIGAGFSGLGLARGLRRAGVEDVVVLERGPDVGGVWQSNTYPGATCDIPSHLYSFSFAPNPEWSATYSPQTEIQDYLRDCVSRFDLKDVIRFGVSVARAAWREDDELWHVDTSEGTWTTRVLVSAVGPLTEPKLPNVPGLERFRGTTMHSSRWDTGHDLTGERVASIGTGASAIQYVPRIADQVGALYVFQRTAPWIVPHDKRPISDVERSRYRRYSVLQRASRWRTYLTKELLVLGYVKRPALMTALGKRVMAHMQSQVADEELRAVLTPDYTFGCKRVVPSNDWYPALQKPAVTLVPHALREVRESSVVDADGVEREVDTIILATGFQVAEMPFADHVVGRDGRTLRDVWGQTPRAYLGAAVPGFPNYFMMLGPNTGLGHSSMIYMAESQIRHVVRAVSALRQDGRTVIEVDRRVHDAYNRDLDRKLESTVWEIGGCSAFYRDASGRNAAIWPDWTWRFRLLAARPIRKAYRLSGMYSQRVEAGR